MKNRIVKKKNREYFGYPVAITPEIQSVLEREGGDGPVSRQFLPSDRERDYMPEELSDPIGDDLHSPVKGVVHRYPDRVLLKPTHRCAVYCRFCFRRDMVGPDSEVLSDEDLKKALAYIRNTPGIWEVILTGGDPLVLSSGKLKAILSSLDEIDHVKIVRIHSRVPVAAPDKIAPRLLESLKTKKPVWISVHCNHASELTPNVRAALARIKDAGIPMVSQSVLLKGVNDTVEALEGLFRALVENNVKPYYLHHCDMAPGTAHFRTSIEDGQALMAELRKRLSGLALPTYMYEMPGGYGKYPIPG